MNKKINEYLAEKLGYNISPQYGCYAYFSLSPMPCVMDEFAYSDCRFAHEGFDKTICKEWKKVYLDLPDFSTWEGFGLLWDWAKKQEWFKSEFTKQWTHDEGWENNIHINPEKFAMAIYNFLIKR